MPLLALTYRHFTESSEPCFPSCHKVVLSGPLREAEERTANTGKAWAPTPMPELSPPTISETCSGPGERILATLWVLPPPLGSCARWSSNWVFLQDRFGDGGAGVRASERSAAIRREAPRRPRAGPLGLSASRCAGAAPQPRIHSGRCIWRAKGPGALFCARVPSKAWRRCPGRGRVRGPKPYTWLMWGGLDRWGKNNRVQQASGGRRGSGCVESCSEPPRPGSVSPGRAGSPHCALAGALAPAAGVVPGAHPAVPGRARGGHQGEERPPGCGKRTKLS